LNVVVFIILCIVFLNAFRVERGLKTSPDCSGKPTAKCNGARTWNGKRAALFLIDLLFRFKKNILLLIKWIKN